MPKSGANWREKKSLCPIARPKFYVVYPTSTLHLSMRLSPWSLTFLHEPPCQLRPAPCHAQLAHGVLKIVREHAVRYYFGWLDRARAGRGAHPYVQLEDITHPSLSAIIYWSRYPIPYWFCLVYAQCFWIFFRSTSLWLKDSSSNKF